MITAARRLDDTIKSNAKNASIFFTNISPLTLNHLSAISGKAGDFLFPLNAEYYLADYSISIQFPITP